MSEPVLELRPTTARRLALLGAVVAVYVALLLAAAWGTALAFLALLVVALLLDLYIDAREEWLRGLLRMTQLSLSMRGIVATLAFALLLSRVFEDWNHAQLLAMTALVVSLPLCRSAYMFVLSIYRARAERPMEVRNVDIGTLVGPPPPPAVLTSRMDRTLVLLGGVTLVLASVGAAVGRQWPVVVVATAYDVLVLGAAVYVAGRALELLRQPNHVQWERRVLARVRALDAQVVLYFSGSPSASYQIDMWLTPLESLPLRTVVLLRERSVLRVLAPTTLPVVCMPSGVSVMQAGFSGARVALYPANTSKNLHLLREPQLRHVFIGHGDSDKVSSINPFTRVYDQVWVAGRAARDRWARAQVGVRDEAVVEVGRPQLDAVHLGPRRSDPNRPAPAFTVLYAPTWEGWNDDTFFSSITSMGPRLVSMLLKQFPDVRIIYKPHPFTGTRDRQARQSHERIVGMLAAANGSGPAAGSQPMTTAPLPRRGDLVTDSRARAAKWAADFWAAHAGSHVVVEPNGVPLYDCFNHADALVADVSSVVSDFLASAKPYVCANPQGLAEDEFVQQNPSAGAGYLLDPECRRLVSIVEQVRGTDPLAPRRSELRDYLLGPDEPPSLERWRGALEELMVAAKPRSPEPLAVDESVIEEMRREDDEQDAAPSDAPAG